MVKAKEETARQEELKRRSKELSGTDKSYSAPPDSPPPSPPPGEPDNSEDEDEIQILSEPPTEPTPNQTQFGPSISSSSSSSQNPAETRSPPPSPPKEPPPKCINFGDRATDQPPNQALTSRSSPDKLSGEIAVDKDTFDVVNGAQIPLVSEDSETASIEREKAAALAEEVKRQQRQEKKNAKAAELAAAAARAAAEQKAREDAELLQNPIIVEDENAIFWGLNGSSDLRQIKNFVSKRGTTCTSFQTGVLHHNSSAWSAYPITRTKPKDHIEVTANEIFGRPIVSPNDEVLVSLNYGLLSCTVTRVVSVKHKYPGGTSFWKYQMSQFVSMDEQKQSLSSFKKSSSNESIIEKIIGVLPDTQIFVLFTPGMPVVELSNDGNSKIGVVRSYPLDIQSIPVTQLLSINGADGSHTRTEVLFDRKLTYQVRIFKLIFIFVCSN